MVVPASVSSLHAPAGMGQIWRRPPSRAMVLRLWQFPRSWDLHKTCTDMLHIHHMTGPKRFHQATIFFTKVFSHGGKPFGGLRAGISSAGHSNLVLGVFDGAESTR